VVGFRLEDPLLSEEDRERENTLEEVSVEEVWPRES
jgi:hypothetical protein